MMGNHVPNESGIPWAAIKDDYVNGRGTVREIGAHCNVSEWSIYKRARREGWRRRQPACANRIKRKEEPLQRLKGLARRRIELLEANEQSAGSDHETDAAIARMTALLKLIERITTLEQKEKALERARKPARVVNDARRLELARRLESLRRQLEMEGDRQPSDG